MRFNHFIKVPFIHNPFMRLLIFGEERDASVCMSLTMQCHCIGEKDAGFMCISALGRLLQVE
jgi:hypothetical protein